MNKLITLVLVLALTLSLVAPTFAKTATPGATRQEKVATKAALLKERLAKFKDQKKAERVEKINDNLASINKKRTEQMLKFLDKALRILGRLEDTTETKAAINKAKTQIASAKQDVLAQAQKEYTINLISEATTKTDAKSSRDMLRNDLQDLKIKLTDAKQAVSAAIRVAATTLGGKK